MYVSLFGRDTLTAAWQAAMASRDMMPGTLAELARWQGTEVNDWRDEQPGRMLHQAESGPLAMLNMHPLRRYYGSITTSGFYPVVVSELSAFVYVAKLHLSELLWWLDEKDEARRLYHEATELKKRFNEAFWMDEPPTSRLIGGCVAQTTDRTENALT